MLPPTPEEQLAKILPVFEAIKHKFREIADRIPPETDSAVVFQCPPIEGDTSDNQ